MVTVGKAGDELKYKPMATKLKQPAGQEGRPVNLPNRREHSLLDKSIPDRLGQRDSVKRFKRRRNNSLPRDYGRQSEYEIARTLFQGAEARNKLYVVINKEESAQNNFADLHLKLRIDALRQLLNSDEFQMKKYKRKIDKDYKLEVSVEKEELAKILVRTSEIAGCRVKVVENLMKNTIKGLLIDHDEDLKGMSSMDLEQAVTTPGVVKILRYGESKVLEVSFKGQNKPSHVYFCGRLALPVKPYIDPPVRCFKCQLYGHMSRTCRSNCYVCFKCAYKYDNINDHSPKDCKEAKQCVNCGKEHVSGFKKCEKHVLEVKWATICYHQKIARDEARKRYPDGKVPKFSGALSQPSQDSSRLTGQHQTTMETSSQQLQLQNEMEDLRKRMAVQEKIINRLRDDMKKKDQEFTEVHEEKESLIVENDKLRVSSNKTMAQEIASLKRQLSQLKQQQEQEMSVDEISELQYLKLENEALQRQLHESVEARKPNSNDVKVKALQEENENLKAKIKSKEEKNKELHDKTVELQKAERDRKVSRSGGDSPDAKKQRKHNR